MCVYVCVSVCVGVGVGVGVCVVVGGAWILKGRVCGGLVTGSPHARSHHHPRMMNPCMRMSVWVYVCVGGGEVCVCVREREICECVLGVGG